MKKKKIALIIGHKATKPGATNERLHISEFALMSLLVHSISPLIHKAEIVIVYRDDYADLPQKVNETGADIAISFHANACNGAATGSEVLYYKDSADGKRIAELFQKCITISLGLRDRAIKGIGRKERGGHLLYHTKMPTIILEPFFIDNDSDMKIFMQRLLVFADNLIKTIETL